MSGTRPSRSNRPNRPLDKAGEDRQPIAWALMFAFILGIIRHRPGCRVLFPSVMAFTYYGMLPDSRFAGVVPAIRSGVVLAALGRVSCRNRGVQW